MDGDSSGEEMGKGSGEGTGEGGGKEEEKGDTFITRRRATGKIERQVVFARGSLPGPRGGREEGARAISREDSVAR